MAIISRKMGSALLGLVLLSGSAWAAPTAIKGEVRGPDGKPVKGAEVTIERTGGKAWTNFMKTDGQGRFIFRDLDMGTYNLRVSANGLATTTATKIQTRLDGAYGVNFELKKQTGTAAAPAPTKKVKHMVWMPGETGSHLGGRWVEVEDTTGQAGPSVNNVQRAGGGAIRGIQNTGGPNVSAGGN